MIDLTNHRIVLAGGSGFLGTSMAAAFVAARAEVTVLARSRPKVIDGWQVAEWDGRTLGDWQQTLAGATAVVNLAGRSVDCIKTPDHQDEILRSRVESTRVLGKALRVVESPPLVWVQMSTAHIYGDPPTAVCDETAAEGMGLAPTVARAWESTFAAAKLPDQRGVVLRTSFVVGRNRGAGNGALGKLSLAARMGLGGRVGRGTQGMSWIHEADLNRLFAQAIVDETMSGVYNATAPHPVSQVEFMRVLRKTMGVPIGLPAFEWMVRLGAPLVLRTDPELALYGRYVVPARLIAHGFEFEYPELAPALAEVYR
ncbi:TIGR01777 family oxidoreductase [Aeoliella mucimassa]|uniref:Epimerase family protein n=1 Tax=Aeoliella mucimassa TaxID=2527972 RepID=A0A518AGP4_9BACT|nr:TIGR01777 family oxidoreductase [Aeoliella mucimassa]QDU53859.1 Epimerase family protein [Aeoliella mucimassa]